MKKWVGSSRKTYSGNIYLGIILVFGWVATVGAQQVPTTPGQPSKVAAAPAQAKGNVSTASMLPKVEESWSTPSLEGSDLKLVDAVSEGVDTIDGVYTHEVVRVQWRPGDPIDLFIIKPVGVKNPPVILYLYSFPFETDRFLDQNFCKFVVKNGYAAVGFPSALTAERYHPPRPMKEWFVSQMPESLATTAHDVQMILNYLAARGDFDMDRVGMFGDGSGASIAILAAAVDPRIKSLDLLDPWGDWPDWVAESKRIPEKERPNFLKPEWLDAAAPLDPVKWLPGLKTPKIRIQCVKNIAVTPADVQQKTEAAAPASAKIVRYDSLAEFQTAVAGGTGFDWIKETLQFSVVPGYSAAGQAQQKPASAQTKDSRQ